MEIANKYVTGGQNAQVQNTTATTNPVTANQQQVQTEPQNK